METCEGRALEVAKAVLPSRSPPGHARILHRLLCKIRTVHPALWAHHLQATQAGRLSRVETDCELFACTQSVGRQKMHGRIRSVRLSLRFSRSETASTVGVDNVLSASAKRGQVGGV